jgi:hypothetical protein
MTKGYASILLFWYFAVYPSGFQSAVQLGPFPTLEVCEAIRAVALAHAPDQVPLGTSPSIAQRLSPCWWTPDPITGH